MQFKNQPPIQIFNSNNKKDPHLSILIPTFKRINLLESAILSAIKQDTSLDYEIIVVDNDQSKDSLDLIKKLNQKFPSANLRLYQNRENIGLYGNWNACLSLGSSKWMTILSDDDLLKPNWMREMWEAKDNLKDPILIGCELDFNKKKYYQYKFFKNVISFYEKKNLLKLKIRKLSVIDYFIEMPHVGCLGVLFNRKAAIEYGGFNKDYHPCSDYKLLADISSLKKSYLINKKLAVYNIGSDNLSQKPESVYQGLINNRKIQVNLISYMPFKLNLLYKLYIKLFLARSISGYRKGYCKYSIIRNFIKENNLNFKFNFIFYFSLKTFLLIIANIHRYAIKNEI